MVNIFIVGCIAIFGLLIGSFIGAQIWRLRARQLEQDKKEGYAIDKKEFKRLSPLLNKSLKADRSRCLSCHHELAALDLIPLFSWVSTGGKCRYCKHRIGAFEPLIELGTALLFVAVYLALPQYQIGFGDWEVVGWLFIASILVALFVYDLKWFLLPDRIVFPLIGLAALTAIGRILISKDGLMTAYDILGSVAILSGLYFLLYIYSRYRNGEDRTWVGFGDVKLNLALGLLLASWQLAFLTVFLANFIGLVVILPALLTKKLTMKTQVPFGPLLIVGFFISLFWGQAIINWYVGMNSGLSSMLLMSMI